MTWKVIESILVYEGGHVATHVHLIALRMGGNQMSVSMAGLFADPKTNAGIGR